MLENNAVRGLRVKKIHESETVHESANIPKRVLPCFFIHGYLPFKDELN